MKRAFLVTGAECSGNRLMAGLLVSAGCWGRPTNKQPKPRGVPVDADKVVVISHLHDELDTWVWWLKDREYQIHAILMARDPWVQVQSRAKASGQSEKECLDRYDSDYKASFSVILRRALPFTIVTYECLLAERATERILSLFDLKQERPLEVMGQTCEIRDENKKWITASG